MDGDIEQAAGKLFQAAAAETAKDLVPITLLVRRINGYFVSAERRHLQPSAVETKTASVLHQGNGVVYA